MSSANRGEWFELQVVCTAHSPVCSTLRIAQKSLTVFFCDVASFGGGMRWSMFQELGCLYGVSERGVVS